MSDETKPCVGCGRGGGTRSARGACELCERAVVAYPLSETARRVREAEIDRLRALIKQVEANAVSGEDSEQTTGVCPWCGAWRANVGVASVPPQQHLDTCPAFTPDGQVR